MAKTRVEGKRVTGRKAPNAAKKANSSRAPQGVAKLTRPRGRSTRLEAGKGVVDKLKDAKGRLRKLRIGEEVEMLAKQQTQATSEAKKTSDKQESNLMASNEDVLDGLKQQPQIRSTIQDFQSNYGLPQDLPDAAVGETDKPQHVLVIAEKGTRVPDVISSIPYYIPKPPDGKWEIDLTILKLDKDLSGIEPTKGLNYKEVTADGWVQLLTHRIPLPFDNSLENFGVSSVDADDKPVINGCVYILIELRGIQFVIHAIGRLNSKEDVGLRNSIILTSTLNIRF